MSYQLKAVFYPAQEPDSEYLGSASLTVADAILIRGIAVLKPEASDLSVQLAFPTFGSQKRAYIQPENRDTYARMRTVITSAVKECHFLRAEVPGSMEPVLSVPAYPPDTPDADTPFSLQLAGLCTIHGITTSLSAWPLPDGSKVAVHMPNLKSVHAPDQTVPICEGLITAHERTDGSIEYRDYQQIIDRLVRDAREKHLSMQHIHQAAVPSKAGEPSVSRSNATQPDISISSSTEIAR